MSLGLTAFLWGLGSALSLPLGALFGLYWRPKRIINASFMAFGAGALIFALTIELFGHVPHYVEEHGMGVLVAAVIGAISGGLLFDVTNQLLNNRGAFLRKIGSARKYVAKLKLMRAKRLTEELCNVKILSSLEPEHIAQLIQRVRKESFSKGDVVFCQGDDANEMYFIVSGMVEILHHDAGEAQKEAVDKRLAVLEKGDIFGELGILLDKPRTADAVAVSDVRVYKITKSDFDEILRGSPELQKSIRELADSRLDDLNVKSLEFHNEVLKDETIRQFEMLTPEVTAKEIQEEGKAVAPHVGGVALAIWLGILIDGIPESLIIGLLAISPAGMSLAFIAGVFLANFPEAMSSAVSMQNSGMKFKKIMLMWGSICVITGVGAWIGAVGFPHEPTGGLYYFMIGIEGMAAGAMLTMIAETMLPEAYEQGGAIVGFSTLCGFLTALFVKVI